jgi:hypothetical protein
VKKDSRQMHLKIIASQLFQFYNKKLSAGTVLPALPAKYLIL